MSSTRLAPVLFLLLGAGLLGACAPTIDDDKSSVGEVDDGGDDGDDPSLSDCPVFEVERTQLTWTGAIIGNVGVETVFVRNSCTEGDPITLAVVQQGSPTFTVSSEVDLLGFALGPGETASLEVTYTADDYADDTGSLLVADTLGLQDTVQIDLAGSPTDDQDLDGYAAVEAGGDDCDDSEDRIHPDATDAGVSLEDLDCDGLKDEDRVQPNDLLITELMPSPLAGTPDAGQWFEVQNVSGVAIDLAGWTLVSDTGLTVTLPLDAAVVEPDARFVLGASDNLSANGGLEPDLVWGEGAFTLDADRDGVSIQVEGRQIHRVAWGDGWPLTDGRAIQLDREFITAAAAANDAYWCRSTQVYGLGDQGSPGDENSRCATVDHDFDGVTPAEGDCNDNDPTISPEMAEVWDEIDNNCDGLVDRVDETSAIASVVGDAGDALGGSDGLSVGDVDGDGVDDLFLASSAAGGNARTGITYIISGPDFVASAGTDAPSLEFATIEGTSSYASMGILGPRMGDHDGDGTDDVFVAGSPYGSYYGGYLASLFFGGSGVSGNLDDDDGDVRLTSSASYRYYTIAPQVVSHLDIDADGLADVILGDSGTYDYTSGSSGYYLGVVGVLLGEDLVDGSDLVLEDDSAWLAAGAESQDYLGSTVGGADIDGDGYDDFFVGARGADDGGRDGGAIYLVYGSSSVSADDTIDNLADLTIAGNGNGDALGDGGTPVVADIDGDGTLDLLVSAAQEGELYLFHDVASLTGEVDTRDADLRLEGDGGDYFGSAFEVADVDGDGAPEIIGTDPDYSPTTYYSTADDPGGAYVFSGVHAGVRDASDADFQIVATTTRGLGASLLAWDADGDGNDELLVSEPALTYGTTGYGAGTVYLFDPR